MPIYENNSIFDDWSCDSEQSEVHENTKENLLHKKPFLLPWALLLVAVNSSGCISIRNVSPSEVSNCSQLSVSKGSCDEFFPLYDRGQVVKQLAGRLNPAQTVPESVTNWLSNQRSHCLAAKDSVHVWYHQKKEAANAPPWPRFHPIPTKPVFEPDPMSESSTPEAYGRFRKE